MENILNEPLCCIVLIVYAILYSFFFATLVQVGALRFNHCIAQIRYPSIILGIIEVT